LNPSLNPRHGTLWPYPFDKPRCLLAGGHVHRPAATPDAQTAEGRPTAFARELLREYNVRVLSDCFLAREAYRTGPGSDHVPIAPVAGLEDCLEALRRINQYTPRL